MVIMIYLLGTTVGTWYLVRDTREYQVHGMIAHQQITVWYLPGTSKLQ